MLRPWSRWTWKSPLQFFVCELKIVIYCVNNKAQRNNWKIISLAIVTVGLSLSLFFLAYNQQVTREVFLCNTHINRETDARMFTFILAAPRGAWPSDMPLYSTALGLSYIPIRACTKENKRTQNLRREVRKKKTANAITYILIEAKQTSFILQRSAQHLHVYSIHSTEVKLFWWTGVMKTKLTWINFAS